MIQSKTDLKYYIEQDRLMNGVQKKSNTFRSKIKEFFIPNLQLRFLYYLRKAEYYSNSRKANILLWGYYIYRKRKLGLKLGYSIPINCFGPGLSLPHTGTVVVNKGARIGANCRLHVNTNIGTSAGGRQAPKIGDNVYIGPGAILFGNIVIGNNITIGANATVNKSFEKENCVVVGSPALVVKDNYPNWMEFNSVNR